MYKDRKPPFKGTGLRVRLPRTTISKAVLGGRDPGIRAERQEVPGSQDDGREKKVWRRPQSAPAFSGQLAVRPNSAVFGDLRFPCSNVAVQLVFCALAAGAVYTSEMPSLRSVARANSAVGVSRRVAEITALVRMVEPRTRLFFSAASGRRPRQVRALLERGVVALAAHLRLPLAPASSLIAHRTKPRPAHGLPPDYAPDALVAAIGDSYALRTQSPSPPTRTSYETSVDEPSNRCPSLVRRRHPAPRLHLARCPDTARRCPVPPPSTSTFVTTHAHPPSHVPFLDLVSARVTVLFLHARLVVLIRTGTYTSRNVGVGGANGRETSHGWARLPAGNVFSSPSVVFDADFPAEAPWCRLSLAVRFPVAAQWLPLARRGHVTRPRGAYGYPHETSRCPASYPHARAARTLIVARPWLPCRAALDHWSGSEGEEDAQPLGSCRVAK
ncbi:hypothetical protein DFH06DRAFT_1309257 [Mycena polygramma]|nr:hypothetical protein DFH06DRAFT_1309257 [Mycena polygramma]